MPSTSDNNTDTYEDTVWAVDKDGHVGFRLANYTPHGIYSELEAVFGDREDELLEQCKFTDHVEIGTATLEKTHDGTVRVIDVESDLDNHTVDW